MPLTDPDLLTRLRATSPSLPGEHKSNALANIADDASMVGLDAGIRGNKDSPAGGVAPGTVLLI